MTSHEPYGPKGLAIQAAAVGFSVGAVVYHQAMTQLVAEGLGVDPRELWMMSVATQFGYGAGLILALPMGDKWPARRLIPISVMALGAVLLLQGLVQSLVAMVVLCALAGVLSVGGQLLIAHAAKTAPPDRRASIVGMLLSALFGGLLIARFLGGWGGELLGWRWVYGFVGVCGLLLAALLPGTLRNARERVEHSVISVLRQQARLWNSLPELRRLSFLAACFFAASNGLWANLGALTASTLNWSSGLTGALALVSAFSIAAPWVSMQLQKRMRWQRVVVLAAGAIIVAAAGTLSLGVGLLSLAAYLALSDLSVRCVQALAQSRALAIDPAAASRINSLFMTVFFAGAAIGSWLGGVFTEHWGWAGVLAFSALAATLGGLLTLRTTRFPAPMEDVDHAQGR